MVAEDISFQRAINRDWFRRALTIDFIADLEYQQGELLLAEAAASAAWIELTKAQIADLEAEIERRLKAPALYTVSPTSKFTPELIQEIKGRTDLVALLAADMPVIGPGPRGDFKAYCPFHTEEHPSFVIHSKTNRFHCFGCGADGDAIQYLMKFHNLTFRETLTRLARNAGVTIPDVVTNRQAIRLAPGGIEIP